MSKIDINVTIKNSEINDTYKVKAIITEEIIKYMEPNGTKVEFNYNSNQLIRENSEMKMIYNFNKGDSIILIKEYNRHIDIIIKTNKIKRDNNNLLIDYEINNEKFLYRIEEIK